MRQPVWRCKVRGCRTYGWGGPDIWIVHFNLRHARPTNSTSAYIETAYTGFGFAPPVVEARLNTERRPS